MLRYARREIHQFAHQLKISPVRLRESQITGAQELATLIEPDKNYPYDFVCYHITKYRKANGTTGVSLPGRELLRDLSTLVDDLSRAAPAPAAQATEKLHTIE